MARPNADRVAFWCRSTTNVLADGMPDLVFQQTGYTFHEDQKMLELEQREISDQPDPATLDITEDRGGRLARRLLRSSGGVERKPRSESIP